jgi:hypothetical protein
VAVAGLWDAYHTRYAKHSKLEKMYMTPDIDSPDKRIIGGDIDRFYVCVFEVKVSRPDFLNTFGNKDSVHAKARSKPAGTAHWIVADKGVCEPSELPDFWGLLVPYGSGLMEKKIPKLNILPHSVIHAIAFDMIWLEKNHRSSYYEARIKMADAIQEVYQAILKDMPRAEILRLSDLAVKSCNGLSLIKKEQGSKK